MGRIERIEELLSPFGQMITHIYSLYHKYELTSILVLNFGKSTICFSRLQRGGEKGENASLASP